MNSGNSEYDRAQAAQLGRIEARLDALSDDIHDVDAKFDDYTHLFQFTPVQKIVYGMAGAILLSVLASLMGLILVSTGSL